MGFIQKMLHLESETTLMEHCYNYKHLCQDSIIEEELYRGTSKGAEGYAA